MFKHTMARIKRKPHFMLAMVVFSAVLAAVLCSLNRNIEDEIAEYEEAYATIPVTVQMCDLMGVEVDDLEAFEYAYNVMLSDYELGTYLKDIQFKCSLHSWVLQSLTIDISGTQQRLDRLVGISSREIDSELAQRSDNVFAWFEGYDESILQGNELVCLIPESLMQQSGGEPFYAEIVIRKKTAYTLYGEAAMLSRKVLVVGTHKAKSDTVYLPFSTLWKIRKDASTQSGLVDAASAVMADNYMIEQFREEMLDWFPEPNDTGEETYWERGYQGWHYYPVAMKIDDSRLQLADSAMQNSIKINTLCSYVVLGLSAVAGFFVGFLAIRSRKREITLMRSLGNSGLSIFAGCCFEQLLCLVLGTAIGGAAFMWRPIEQIGIFMGIYFLGTIVSLVIFISRNLLQGQKEDE